MSSPETPSPESQQITDVPPSPQGPTDIKDDRIPLPPPVVAPPQAPDAIFRRFALLEGILLILVLAFAFLCASFRAQNTDVFLHLATGRALVDGSWRFGPDPFTFTAGDQTWVNHAWLYDLVIYGLYSLPSGDVILVVLKALLITLVAWLMFRSGCRDGQPRWWPLLFTLLGVLSLSPRAFVQSMVLSYVLLALFIYVLVQVEQGKVSLNRLLVLPGLCVLWVNVDPWFLLGPLVVALYLAGEGIQQRVSDKGASTSLLAGPTLAQLGIVLGACVAACVVNPFHVFAFRLPLGVVQPAAGTTLMSDMNFRGLFVSPIESIYFQPSVGQSVAGIAIFVLAGLGLISFVLAFVGGVEQVRWWRVLVWLAFAGLAAWNFRAIPFLAIVSAPIAALNILDFARLMMAGALNEPIWRRWSIAGRMLTIVLAIGLIVAGIPGWLQGRPHTNRRLAYGIDVDPGLREAALTMAEWREQGLTPEQVEYINLAPEVVNYFAWFCPKARGFIDHRLELFGDVADDYKDLRQSLSGYGGTMGQRRFANQEAYDKWRQQRKLDQGNWRKIMTKRKLRVLVFHAHNPASVPALLLGLDADPKEWRPCFVQGRTAIYYWNDPRRKMTTKGQPPTVDFNRLAFGKGLIPVPDDPGFPEPPSWWKPFVIPPSGVPSETNTAFQHLSRFQARQEAYLKVAEEDYNKAVRFRLATLASWVYTAPCNARGPVGGNFPLLWRVCFALTSQPASKDQKPGPFESQIQNVFFRPGPAHDSGPPSALYLAVRACRRALAENPADHQAYNLLALSYNLLRYQTRENSDTGNLLPAISLIRQSQIAWALNSILQSDPSDETARDAHHALSQLFSLPRYFEARVKHFKKFIELSTKIGKLPGVPAREFRDQIEAATKQLAAMEKELKSRTNQFEVQTTGKKALEKAAKARQVSMGLVETAVDALINPVDPRELRNPRNQNENVGARWAAEMLLGLGRINEARQVLEPEESEGRTFDPRLFGSHEETGLPAHEFLTVQLNLAVGNYKAADAILKKLDAAIAVNEEIYLQMGQMDLVPLTQKKNHKSSLELLAGMVTGDILLRQAQRAGQPGALLQHLPLRVHAKGMKLALPWQVELGAAVRFFTLVQQSRANVQALRMWAALEAGDLDRVDDAANACRERSFAGMIRKQPFYRVPPLYLLCAQRLGSAKRNN